MHVCLVHFSGWNEMNFDLWVDIYFVFLCFAFTSLLFFSLLLSSHLFSPRLLPSLVLPLLIFCPVVFLSLFATISLLHPQPCCRCCSPLLAALISCPPLH